VPRRFVEVGMNAYAPPTIHVPQAGGSPPAGAWLKWPYLVTQAALAACFLVREILVLSSMDADALPWRTLAKAMLVSGWALGIAWIHSAFRSIPEKHRPVTPLAAAVSFFIPVYGIYWLFAVHVKLGRAISAARSDRRLEHRSAIPLALAAVVATLIAPYLPYYLMPVVLSSPGMMAVRVLSVVVPGLLWLLYMRE
jgi:hypothetical protein